MKNFTLIALALVLSLTCLYAQGPANPTTTTLQAALTGTDSSTTPGSSTDVIQVATTSGFVQNSVGQYLTLLYVDFEAMDVVAVLPPSSNGLVRVVRGAWGTKATKHANGATVYVGSPNSFGGAAAGGANWAGDKNGACTAANEAFLPFINISDGKIFNCLSSGQWIQTGLGTMGGAPAQLINQFCTGAVTSSSTTDYVNDGVVCATTSGQVPVVVSTPGVLFNFRVHSSANATSTSSDQIATVVKNGTATAITCNLSGVAVCSDLTHSVAVAAGDLITFSYLTGTTDTAANLTMSVEKQ
jgi:hypothetical protein